MSIFVIAAVIKKRKAKERPIKKPTIIKSKKGSRNDSYDSTRPQIQVIKNFRPEDFTLNNSSIFDDKNDSKNNANSNQNNTQNYGENNPFSTFTNTLNNNANSNTNSPFGNVQNNGGEK